MRASLKDSKGSEINKKTTFKAYGKKWVIYERDVTFFTVVLNLVLNLVKSFSREKEYVDSVKKSMYED